MSDFRDVNEEAHIEAQKQEKVSSFVIGLCISLALTLTSYFLVVHQILSGWTLILTISTLAIIQMFVQLLSFLHIESDERPRWNVLAFIFMAFVVLILVGGSLWIMYTLDGRVMPTMNANTNLQHQHGI